MKTQKKIELDVDFIGGQEKPLTNEEELKISEYIRRNKKSDWKIKLKKLYRILLPTKNIVNAR